MLKKAFYLVLVFAILFASVPSLAVTTKPSNITVKLNNKTITLDGSPKEVNGRILVPVAPLAKELGATIEWIGNTESVIITLQTNNISKTIYLKVGQTFALVNGMELKLDCKPVIFNNRTYIPLRFILETFGANVKWDGKTKTVSITYSVPIQEKPPMLPAPWELHESTTATAITVND